MAIVPSGKFRLMVAQQVGEDLLNLNKQIEDKDVPENLTVEPQQPADFAKKNEESQFSKNLFQQGQNQPEVAPGTGSSSIRDYVFDKLKTLGVSPARLNSPEKQSQIFNYKIDFDGKRKGFFVVPLYTQNRPQISEEEATKIGQEFANKFGLKFAVDHTPIGFKINFESKDEAKPSEDSNGDGSSFDLMNKGNQKTASTLSEMLTSRQEELQDKLMALVNRKKD